ncbi:hypothetical protein [Janibacter melonis]|uniref:hypothetical protein n=1 Tax=Janibacter melonis TaxID=262209 RepID=UPI0020956516|nr:hypothetical protein [Janibacter melonis]
MIGAFARWHAEQHQVARIVQYEFRHLSPSTSTRCSPCVARSTRSCAGRRRRVASGDFEVEDTHAAALALLSLVADVARWYHPGVQQTPSRSSRRTAPSPSGSSAPPLTRADRARPARPARLCHHHRMTSRAARSRAGARPPRSRRRSPCARIVLAGGAVPHLLGVVVPSPSPCPPARCSPGGARPCRAWAPRWP